MINQLFTKPFGFLTTPANWGRVKLSRLFTQAGKIATFSATLGSINYFTPVKALAASSNGPSEQDVAQMLKNSNALTAKYDEMHQKFHQNRREDELSTSDSHKSAALFCTFYKSKNELERCFRLPVPEQARIEGIIHTCNLFVKIREQHLKTVKDYRSKSKLIDKEVGEIYSGQDLDKLAEHEFSLVASRITYLKQLQDEANRKAVA